ncbi:hypothetical protein VTI28DRAFT_5897 [Corynascus sepedonium]
MEQLTTNMVTPLFLYPLARPFIYLLLLLNLTVTVINARDAPQNLLDFYDSVRAQGHCYHELASGFYSSDGGTHDFAYCGDHLKTLGVIYIQGRSGALANLDVDCDGAPRNGSSNDGRCRRELSPDVQNATSFRDVIGSYGSGSVVDLDPYVHPYVVFGNARGTRSRSGWQTFDPAEYGMRPLSVMAVVCPSRKLVDGMWWEMGDWSKWN